MNYRTLSVILLAAVVAVSGCIHQLEDQPTNDEQPPAETPDETPTEPDEEQEDVESNDEENNDNDNDDVGENQ